MKSLPFFFAVCLLLSCRPSTGTETQEDEPLATQTAAADTAAVQEAALSFHLWYLENAAKGNAVPIEAQVGSGADGQAQLITNPYFLELQRLGSISDEFLDRERARFRPCAQAVKSVSWEEYQQAEPGMFDQECGFLSYYYWLRSQEVMDGVEAVETTIDDDEAGVRLRFYDMEEGNKSYWPDHDAIVHLTATPKGWMITEIEWASGDE